MQKLKTHCPGLHDQDESSLMSMLEETIDRIYAARETANPYDTLFLYFAGKE